MDPGSTELSEAEIADVDFADAPFVAQEAIRAKEHRRVVTVGTNAWVASLAAEGRPLDWRKEEEAHAAWVPTTDTSTAEAALEVAEAFDLGYSSQDWIVAEDGREVFVDLNPGGQWLFLPNEVSEPATAAIAEFLAVGAL